MVLPTISRACVHHPRTRFATAGLNLFGNFGRNGA